MTTAKAVVLVVEDELVLRTAMVHGLAKLPNVEVVEAGTVVKALSEVEERRPPVIIVDLDLPDGSGLEILEAVERFGARSTVIFVSGRADQANVPERPNVLFRQKPLSLHDLRAIVSEHLVVRESQPPDTFRVEEYIQVAAHGGHSVMITLGDPNAPVGRIAVVNGDVWSAEDARGAGPTAMKRLLRRHSLPVRCTTLREDPGPRSIEPNSSSSILIAAAMEEGGRPSQPAGGPSFDELWERGLEAALRRDLAEAAACFLEAERIRFDPRIRANLGRLADLGYHARTEEEPERRRNTWSMPPGARG